MEAAPVKMLYRFLGNSGLRVSVLSYGTWLTAHDPKSEEAIIECVKKSWSLGINFFDTAEIYGSGIAETILGKALKQLPCKRKDYVVASKYIKCGDSENDKMLGAKHIYEGVIDTLKRMDLEYLDVIFAHRPDYQTPLEETCRAFD
jgi:aryl-alcohol dehydrogenase-like predicted oxidoreductase